MIETLWNILTYCHGVEFSSLAFIPIITAAAKAFGGEAKRAKQKKTRFVTTRWSPWGTTPSEKPQGSVLGDLATGFGQGMQLQQGAQQAFGGAGGAAKGVGGVPQAQIAELEAADARMSALGQRKAFEEKMRRAHGGLGQESRWDTAMRRGHSGGGGGGYSGGY